MKRKQTKNVIITLEKRIQELEATLQKRVLSTTNLLTEEEFNYLKNLKERIQKLDSQLETIVDADTLNERTKLQREYEKLTNTNRTISMDRKKGTVSAGWYLLALFFGLIGGVIGYVATKEEHPDSATAILWIGIISSL